jgi:hypothetical protein
MFELLKERKRNLENTKDIANIPWNEWWLVVEIWVHSFVGPQVLLKC